MNFREYLKDRVPAVAFLVLADLGACAVAAICALERDAVFLIGALLLFALILALLLGYLLSRRFYKEISSLTSQLEHPYQLTSLISRPHRAEHAAIYEALDAMGRASANEVVEERAKAKEQREYMEMWAHEVKTPLAAALLIADHVSEPESRQLKRDIDQAVKQVEKVLWYARSTSAQNDHLIREQSLEAIVHDACKSNARFLIEKGVSLQMDIDPGIRVFTDQKQVSFILSQILVNSAKYGARTIRMSACQEPLRSVLEIKDDGLGIPAEDVPRVFERGFTGKRGREASSATGMGLYIAAQLCESLGLSLHLTSKEGSGTLVSLAFPHDRRRLDADMGRSDIGVR